MDLKRVGVLKCRPAFKVKSKVFLDHFIYLDLANSVFPAEVFKNFPTYHFYILLGAQVFSVES